MRNKHYPILACCLLTLAVLACNLGAPAATPEGQGTNILTLAAQTLQAQTPTADQGISVEAALTLAVETCRPSNPRKPKLPSPATHPSPQHRFPYWVPSTFTPLS
jgi:hypothetical protein